VSGRRRRRSPRIGAAAAGSIGVLDAAVTWASSGVTRSVQDAIPLLRSFVSGARTHPSDGTIELRGALGSSIIVKPQVVNNAISLQVVGLTALGLTLPRAGVQSELDAFTNQLAKDLPLGIHADTVQVLTRWPLLYRHRHAAVYFTSRERAPRAESCWGSAYYVLYW
jgi:hypothetical protein